MNQADLDDKSSLVKAFSGAVVVFAVTNFWEKMSKDLEVQQGKNIVDAAEVGKSLCPAPTRGLNAFTGIGLAIPHLELLAECDRAYGT